MRMLHANELSSALSSLPSQPRAVAPGSFATPLPLLNLVAELLDEWKLFIVNAPKGIPSGPGIHYETMFVGPGMRGVPTNPVSFYPARLSLMPRLFYTTLQPDLVVLHCSEPHGDQISMGIEVQVMRTALEAAKARGATVIAQVNPQMPFVHGDGVLNTDEIDFAVRIENPLLVAPPARGDAASARMGELIAPLVPDGASVQAGIGALPEAVLGALQTRRRLRIWSELIADSAMQLDRCGALDPDVPLTGTFMLGTREFYDWVDDNPRVQLLRCETTNDPAVIAAIPTVISVNTAMQVDLFAQANATRIDKAIYSGTGGAADFLTGAMRSPGGQAIIALKSWHTKADVSTIVPILTEPVTTLQMSTVVTENGVARIWGNDESEQARQLIDNAAHPRAQDALRAAAHQFKLL